MPKPKGPPPAPLTPPAAVGFDLSQVPVLQEGAPAAVPEPVPQGSLIDSPNYIESAKFSLGQNPDMAELTARMAGLKDAVANDKFDLKVALMETLSIMQAHVAVGAVKVEGLLSEIEDSGGIDEEDADAIGDLIDDVKVLFSKGKIIFVNGTEKQEFGQKLKDAEEALENYLSDDEDDEE